MNVELLKKLCLAVGVSGDESMVREIILEEISGYADYEITTLGDIIVHKKGKETPEKKMLIAAHMDEVGMIINDITSDGYIKFITVGAIDCNVLQGKTVYVNKDTRGVIGGKPVHLMHGDEFEKAIPIEQLTIDIGAKDKEEAEQYAMIGDIVNFEPYFECVNGNIMAKSLDDRIGCYLLIEMIKSELPYDMTIAFTTREEIGSMGAFAVSYCVAPDLSIAVEGTVAGDVLGAKGAKQCTKLGQGPAISIKDRGTVYDQKFFKMAFQIAKELEVPCQARTLAAGTNDSQAMHIAKKGARPASLAVPCRYIHSATSMVKVSDVESALKLLPQLAIGMIEDK